MQDDGEDNLGTFIYIRKSLLSMLSFLILSNRKALLSIGKHNVGLILVCKHVIV